MKAKSRFFTLIAVASLLVLLFCTPAVTVYAETPSVPVTAPTESAPDETESEETPQEPSGGAQEPAGEEGQAPAEGEEQDPDESEPSDAVQQFIDGLKEQYGQEWMTYYNAIIAQWGTVENYLMSLLPEDSPDVVKDAWLAFVAWTRDNWVILAAIGATIASAVGVIVYVFTKKRAKAFMLSAYDDKFAKLYEEYNKQSAAIKAQNAMLIAMTGANPKYEETRAALQKTGDELDEPSGETK